MRAGYTETKFVGNYIYNIVTNKNEGAHIGAGDRFPRKESRRKT